MNAMNDDITHDIESALDDDHALAKAAQGTISVNREGSGHTININDSIGTTVVGLIALILLWSLLRSEARNRKLQAQLRPDG